MTPQDIARHTRTQKSIEVYINTQQNTAKHQKDTAGHSNVNHGKTN